MVRLIAALMVCLCVVPVANAQSGVDPRRVALDHLAKRITVDLDEARMEDVVQYLSTVGSLEFEPMWEDDTGREGLDKDALVSMRASNLPILSILERILEKGTDGFSGNAWQLTREGIVQIGPKSRLNEFATLKLYDIQDLLFRVNNYTTVPELDLDAAVQQSQGGGGGGGGQSIFTDDEEDDANRPTTEEEAQQLIDLIVETVEPNEWEDNGGNGGSIRFWRGSLLVRAPDYMHRQLGGYDFWPSSVPTRPADRSQAWRATTGNTVTVAEDPSPAPTPTPAPEPAPAAEQPASPNHP